MTIQQSDGLRNHLQQYGSYRQAFTGGTLQIYAGSQPANANLAPTGTLLAIFTDASGAHTDEVRATGTITLTGSSGTITGITLGGVQILGATITYATSLTNTASLLSAQINKFHRHQFITASASGAVVTLTAARGVGANANGMVLTTTESGGNIAAADVNLGSGVAGVTAVNGLEFDEVATGLLTKRTGQVWSALGLSTNTAGWFRLLAATTDSGALDSAAAYVRMDGSVASSGGDMNASSTLLTASATHTLSEFSPTEPATA